MDFTNPEGLGPNIPPLVYASALVGTISRIILSIQIFVVGAISRKLNLIHIFVYAIFYIIHLKQIFAI